MRRVFMAWVGAAGVAFALQGCAWMAVQTAPAKLPASERTALALQADGLFWQVFSTGRYDDIGRVLEVHKAAYLQNPRDATLAGRIGWLHAWRLSESSRLTERRASIVDDATLARRYFEEAVRLKPDEARYLGFLGAMQAAEASIHHDVAGQRRGYFTLKASIDAWPEFNLFTAGYVMSQAPRDSAQFAQALQWQWDTLDLCAGEKISRSEPDFARFWRRETTTGPQRACWNSTIAPHNFEGFFLNMGDMLVKAGQPGVARKVYAQARTSPTYSQWPFRAELEAREAKADEHAAMTAAAGGDHAKEAPLMIRTTYSCMGCHQK
jgi:hypothetical protein